MPRFAILAHDHPVPHWDLFLEWGSVLRAWRILEPLQRGVPVPAEPIGDHRLLYLDYEGPVSGARGMVSPIDRGTYEWLADTPGLVSIYLQGSVYRGKLELNLVGSQATAVIWPTS